MLFDLFAFGYFCLRGCLTLPMQYSYCGCFYDTPLSSASAIVPQNVINQPTRFPRLAWSSKNTPETGRKENLAPMTRAIQTASLILLKHCDYSGKCQGSPGSHLIFCLLKRQLRLKDWAQKCAPRWQGARRTGLQSVPWKWKTGNLVSCSVFSRTVLCE